MAKGVSQSIEGLDSALHSNQLHPSKAKLVSIQKSCPKKEQGSLRNLRS